MMSARTEFIYAVLLVASFVIEGTQAALAPSGTTLASPSVSSSSVSSMATPMLSFDSLPQPTSCASTTFFWSYSGPDDPMSLQVTNVGVFQAPPPTTTSSSIATTRNLARSTPLDLTLTLVTNYIPLTSSYVWETVNVSQGWFILIANISVGDQFSLSRSPFFVHTETNTSCLTDISATHTVTPTITPSKSSFLSSNTSLPINTIPASDLSSTSTSTSKVPIIVGLSVGMAVLVIGAVIVWFFLTRKGRSRTSDGNSKNNFHRRKGLSDLRGGFDANERYQSSRAHLTSQPSSVATTNLGPESEDGIIGAEKVSEEQDGLALSTLPVLHHQVSRTRPDHTYSASSSSSHVNDLGNRYSTRHSNDTSAVYPPSVTFSSREWGHYTVAHDVSRSHSLSTQYSLSNSIDQTSSSPLSPLSSSSFPPPISIASRETKQMNRQSLGKKRKPVPVYDPTEEEPISSTSTFALPFPNTEPTFPQLSHKSSFGPGGIEGKQLHYLIPDMPMYTS